MLLHTFVAVINLNVIIPKLGQVEQRLLFFTPYFFWVDESIVGRPEDNPSMVDASNLGYARAPVHLDTSHL